MCMTSPRLSTFCPSSDFTFRRYLETHLNILYCLTKLHSNFCNFCFHSAAYVSVRVETLASLFGSLLLHSYSCSGEYSTELAYMNVLARSDVRHMRPCNVVSPAFIWLPTFFTLNQRLRSQLMLSIINEGKFSQVLGRTKGQEGMKGMYRSPKSWYR